MKSYTEERRVLSIQSHVVVGHVGNKSATFPLQLLAFNVDVLNTVQFSNHTGYGRFAGHRFDAAHLRDIFNAMDANGHLRQSHFLTGYTPGAEALRVVADILARLREINPNLIYVLDPVCGDGGRLYVSPDVIPVYKELLARASVTTPNQFEAEIFSGVTINSLDSLKRALDAFHDVYSIPAVIISSLVLSKGELQGFDIPFEGPLLVCAGSSQAPDGTRTAFVICFPEMKEHFEGGGVGDVFSALVLAHFGSHPDHPISSLAYTAEQAIASLSGVIRNTREHAYRLRDATPGDEHVSLAEHDDETPEDRVKRLRYLELRLITSQDEILNPSRRFPAQRL